MNVLGIETSCDETGVAIVNHEGVVLAEALYSQVEEHAEYGGVVPELASRDHVRKLVTLIDKCLADAALERVNLDAIAYTAGPGLVGALFVGAAVGQSLAWALNLPGLPVHHMEAHLLAPILDQPDKIQFPFLCLLVSGGHTMIVKANALGDYEILGESRDDAVGEAFDKVAQQMCLGYPGGPVIERLATQSVTDLPAFPRPMLDRNNLDFSFSGLKTHTLLSYKNSNQTTNDKADIAAAFQAAVFDTLLEKCRRALIQSGLNTLVIAGGVSANKQLRETLTDGLAGQAEVHFPGLKLCTDNGVMVAYAGMLHASKQSINSGKIIKVRPRWPMNELSKSC